VLPTFREPTAVQNIEAVQSTLIEAVQSTLATSCGTEDVCEASAEEAVLRHEVPPVLPTDFPELTAVQDVAAAQSTLTVTENMCDAAADEAVNASTQLPAAAVHFKLPRAVKQSGRPATTRQRTFRAKVAQIASNGEPSHVSPNMHSYDDNCAECDLADPPSVKSKKRLVNWIQCDSAVTGIMDRASVHCLERARYVCVRWTAEQSM